MDRPPSPRPMLGNHYRPGHFVVVSAEPGCGKSSLMMTHGVELAARGKVVLFISAEETIGVYDDKLAAHVVHRTQKHQADDSVVELTDDIVGRIHIANIRDPILVQGVGKYVPNKEVFDVLLAEIQAIKPDLIVIETLATVGSGDESNPAMAAVSQFMTALATMTGACVVLVHHDRKATANTVAPSEPRKDTVRGGSALVGSAREVIQLIPALPDRVNENLAANPGLYLRGLKTKFVSVYQTKVSGAEEASPVDLYFVTVTVPRNDGSADEIGILVPAPRMTSEQRMEVKAEIKKQKKVVKADNRRRSHLEMIVEWISDCEAQGVEPTKSNLRAVTAETYGISGETLWKSLDGLVESGNLEVVDSIYRGKRSYFYRVLNAEN